MLPSIYFYNYWFVRGLKAIKYVYISRSSKKKYSILLFSCVFFSKLKVLFKKIMYIIITCNISHLCAGKLIVENVENIMEIVEVPPSYQHYFDGQKQNSAQKTNS